MATKSPKCNEGGSLRYKWSCQIGNVIYVMGDRAGGKPDLRYALIVSRWKRDLRYALIVSNWKCDLWNIWSCNVGNVTTLCLKGGCCAPLIPSTSRSRMAQPTWQKMYHVGNVTFVMPWLCHVGYVTYSPFTIHNSRFYRIPTPYSLVPSPFSAIIILFTPT